MVGARWSGFGALALAMVALVLAIAPAAEAEGEPDTGAFNAFQIKGSNGYRVLVLASSRKQYRHGEVLILVFREGRSVAYFAPASVTDKRIDADLGALGRIAVEFVPKGKGEFATGCESERRASYEKGFYEGEIELHGEEGYTEVSATRVAYSPRAPYMLVCGGYGSGEGRGRGIPGARLLARRELQGGNLVLEAIQNRPGAGVQLTASIDERRGDIGISREVAASYPAGSFHFDPALRSASLRGAEPFSGSAVFHRGAAPRNQWTGNLAVDFPGRSDVSLTGSLFLVSLIHAERTPVR